MDEEELRLLEALVEKFEATVAADQPCHLACLLLRLHISNALETV